MIGSIPVTSARVDEVCAGPLTDLSSWEATRAFRGLAPWWLSEEALAAASTIDVPRAAFYTTRRVLPREPGACGVLFVSDGALPLLRDAFLLPLTWTSGGPDSPYLPPSVKELADQVRGDLEGVEAVRDGQWGLHLSPVDEIDRLDLRGLSPPDNGRYLRARSGWASVAAALLLLAEGGNPDPLTLATAVWDPKAGLQPVDPHTLPAKVHFARAYGAARFFVPPQQLGDAIAALDAADTGPTGDGGGATVEVVPLQPGFNARAQRYDAAAALRPLLARLEVPPGIEEGFGPRRDYYLRQFARDPASADLFYAARLLPDLIRRTGKELDATHPDGFPNLVTFVSHNWELVPLAAGAVRARRCLVFYTESMAPEKDRARAKVKEFCGDCDVIPKLITFTTEITTMEAEIVRWMKETFPGAEPDRIALDLTPGTRTMLLAALHAVHPRTWLLYLSHEFTAKNLRKPGTERYEPFQAGTFFSRGELS